MPELSVIIPVYNAQKYLAQCLDSVINQTLKDMEIICINDGSTDESLKLLEDYAQKDSRIKIINKENAGYGAACNDGIAQAAGDYTAVLEPDDYIEPQMYLRLLTLAKDNQAEIAKCAYSEVLSYQTPEQINKINWSNNFSLPEGVFDIYRYPEFLYFHPSIWSCVYKTTFIKENNIKFPTPKGAGWADNLFQVQTLCLAKKIVYTDEAYYNYRKHTFCESDVLKDYKIPLERSREIHQWLESTNIKDEKILACLYKRELTYIHLMLAALPLNTLKEGLYDIQTLAKDLDENIVLSNSIFNKREKAFYKSIKNTPVIALIKEKIKQARKKIFSLHLSKEEKSLRLLGRQVIDA